MKKLMFSLIAGGLMFASCSPTEYKIERETMVAAPADLVFEQVNTHKNRDAWSPWEAMDSAMTKSYSGPESGVGAVYSWSGNDSVGTGSLEILESNPPTYIKSKLVFTEPWQSESIIEWNFSEVDGQTKAVWTITGELPGYLFWMDQSDMEEAMAPDFERGLANLKLVAEKKASEMAPAMDVALVEVMGAPYYFIQDEVRTDSVNSNFFGTRYGAIMQYLAEDAQKVSGSPFAIYHKWDMENKMANVEVAIPCESAKPGDKRIKKGLTYTGMAMKCDFYGPYEESGKAHDFVIKKIEEGGYEFAGSPWEVYVTDPATEPDPNKILTEIYYPIAKKMI